MGKSIQSKTRVIGPFRCEFPKLAKPEAFQEGAKEKFSITILVPKDKNILPKTMQTIIVDIIKDGEEIIKKTDWTKTAKNEVCKIMKNNRDMSNKNCLIKDGDVMNKKLEADGKDPLEHYKGHWILRMSCNADFAQPGVYKIDPGTKRPTIKVPQNEVEETVKGGYWVFSAFNLYTYGSGTNAGVTFSLAGVTFFKQDELFGRGNPFGDTEIEPPEPDEMDLEEAENYFSETG